MSLRYTIGKKEHAIEFLKWVDKNYEKTFLGYISKNTNPYKIGSTIEEVYENFMDKKAIKKPSSFLLEQLNKVQRKALVEFVLYGRWNPFNVEEKKYKKTMKSLFYKKLIAYSETENGTSWFPTNTGTEVSKRLEKTINEYELCDN